MEKHSSGYDYAYKPRTIDNHVQQEVMDNADIPMKDYMYAIGRLSIWAAHTEHYKFCVIAHDGMNGDLCASYFSSRELYGKERPAYQIGAIWNKEAGEYSFHS